MINDNLGLKFQVEIFEFLNTHIKYAVLRNYHGLPQKNESRDIDFIVEANSFFSIQKKLVKKIEDLAFNIVIYYKCERLITFVCGNADESCMVQLDFFTSCSVKGLYMISAKDMLEDRIFENGIWHVNKDYEFLDKYCFLKATGHEYPCKYQEVLSEVAKSLTIDETIKRCLGINSLKELLSMSSVSFKRKIVKRNVKKNLWACFTNYYSFIKYHVSNRFHLHGVSVGFTGPDGSGKTTVINGVVTVINQIQRNVPLYHFRPTILQNLGDAAHNVGLKKTVDHQFDKPHRGKRQGVISSFLRLIWYSADYILGYWFKTRMLLSNRNFIVFDRYYTDIIADSRRSKIYISPKFLYVWGKMFIPKLCYNILLTAHSNVILQRKQELDETAINEINKHLDYLKDKQGYYIIWNESTPHDAVRKILKVIFESQHVINTKRLM